VFGIEKLLKVMVDSAFKVTNLEGRGLSKKEVGAFHWIGYSFFPMVMNIVAFIIFVWIMNKVMVAKGFEFAMLICACMLITRIGASNAK
jgi:hypothetical protein